MELRAKSGKALTRYFPEIVDLLAGLKPPRFVLDGELAIPVGKTLLFDALQMRLHPAESRIRKLAHETPAIYILFDLLLNEKGADLRDAPLSEAPQRAGKIVRPLGKHNALRLSPYTGSARRRSAGSRARVARSTAWSRSGWTVPIAPASAP